MIKAGTVVFGIFGRGVVTSLDFAFGQSAAWVKFDEFSDGAKLCLVSGLRAA